jgi:glycosyltransferase involved in cell wall biosynthesis
MTASPRVTVVIPVFNGANYLSQAIESALAQDFDGFEVVVVNDGSADGGRTEEIARGFLPRIRYFSQPNGGVASALNRGIAEARGEYVSWLSHDDLYIQDKLSRQAALLRERGLSRTVVYGDYEIEDVDSGRRLVPAPPRLDRAASPDAQFLSLLFLGRLHGCTMLLPRACFLELGGFAEALRTTQDYDFWFQLLAAGYHFVRLPGPVVVSRLHAAQGTRAMSEIHVREATALYEKYVGKFPVLVAEMGPSTAFDVLRAFEERGLGEVGRTFQAIWASPSPMRALVAPALGWLARRRRP